LIVLHSTKRPPHEMYNGRGDLWSRGKRRKNGTVLDLDGELVALQKSVDP